MDGDKTKFAGSVVLGDLDDFVSPSQACVNPIFADDVKRAEELLDHEGDTEMNEEKKGYAKIQLTSGFDSGVDLQVEPSGFGQTLEQTPDLIKTNSSSKSAQVSLSDCLACSGCVTSAETVLIEQQSTDEFLRNVAGSKWKRVVVSISPQAISSMAVQHNVDTIVAYRKLVTFFKELGAHFVVDSNIGTDIALLEASEEFRQRFSEDRKHNSVKGTDQQTEKAKKDRRPTKWKARPITLAVSSRRIKIVPTEDIQNISSGASSSAPQVSQTSSERKQAKELTGEDANQTVGIIVDLVTGDAVDLDGAVVHVDFSSGKTETRRPTRPGATKEEMSVNEKRVQRACDSVGLLQSTDTENSALPVITSACPGWVCYAEKTHPESLRYISKVKSPQQIMGTILKHMFSVNEEEVNPSEVYHVTVMPCFDKKLEASRKDFFTEENKYSTRDVDCVVTSSEILQLMKEKSTRFEDIKEADLSHPHNTQLQVNEGALKTGALVPPGLIKATPEAIEAKLRSVSSDGRTLLGAVNDHGGSGGYLEYIFRRIAEEVYNTRVTGPLEYRQGRNADMEEVSFEQDGEVKFKFAKAYGFRNIQSVITKMKRGKCPYDYVEIMACPSGCVNGGGQIQAPVERTKDPENELEKTRPSLEKQEERPQLVSDRLQHSRAWVLPEERDFVQFLRGRVYPLDATLRRRLFTTSYHTVPKIQSKLGIKW